MKNNILKIPRLLIAMILLISVNSCQKDQIGNPSLTTVQNQKENTITIDEAQAWLRSSPDSSLINKYQINWESSTSIRTKNGNRIKIPISGSPKVNGTAIGYRQLSIQRDSTTKAITAKILEILPDIPYWQEKGRVDSRDFTGRIFEYDLSYSLQKGKLFVRGKQVGEIRPATQTEKLAYKENPDQLTYLGSPIQEPTGGANGKTSRAQVIESCAWYQTSYIDSEGVLNIYAERVCSYTFYDDGQSGGGGGYSDPGIGTDPPSGGGGGGSITSDPGPPAPSNLPGENNNNVDPKKMTECFGNVKTEGAAFQVKLLVVEPFPGTSFNVGPNSFGHVAIQLTKVNGSQAVTQTLGFYGSGSGLDKLVSPSTIKDNGDIEFDMEASFFTDAQSFQKIIDFINNPAAEYNYKEYNCAKFAYLAAKAGGLDVPDPTTTFGMPVGAFSGGRGMSPAGMASALRSQKAANPNQHNISEGGGRAPASKGECK